MTRELPGRGFRLSTQWSWRAMASKHPPFAAVPLSWPRMREPNNRSATLSNPFALPAILPAPCVIKGCGSLPTSLIVLIGTLGSLFNCRCLVRQGRRWAPWISLGLTCAVIGLEKCDLCSCYDKHSSLEILLVYGMGSEAYWPHAAIFCDSSKILKSHADNVMTVCVLVQISQQ